ncbi:MAG: hypothetical protein QXS68_08275 [Candidatus Methanomethylicaceae archaeon]
MLIKNIIKGKGIKEIEDELTKEVGSWNEYLMGYVYALLYHYGMRIDHAVRLVEKARKKPYLLYEEQEPE